MKIIMKYLNAASVLAVGAEQSGGSQERGGMLISPVFPRAGDTGEEGPMRRYENDEPLTIPKEWPAPVEEPVHVPAEPIKEPVRTPA